MEAPIGVGLSLLVSLLMNFECGYNKLSLTPESVS